MDISYTLLPVISNVVQCSRQVKYSIEMITANIVAYREIPDPEKGAPPWEMHCRREFYISIWIFQQSLNRCSPPLSVPYYWHVETSVQIVCCRINIWLSEDVMIFFQLGLELWTWSRKWRFKWCFFCIS